jgi:L-2,4-diaminobutyrate decarboxylase
VFESDFLSPAHASRLAFREAISEAAAVVAETLPQKPYSGKSPAELADLLAGDFCPSESVTLEKVLRGAEAVIDNSVVVGHPFTAAHLHCPPLISGLAAEVVLSALNQSLDSFDQAPAATVLEQQLLRWLCCQAGLPATADGTMTPGGTLSNYMGLLLARDTWCRERLGWSVREQGLPPEAAHFRILCSEMAHFTVDKSAAQLGLGTRAVVKVAADAKFRMCLADLDKKLAELARQELIPLAIVATAGTTDFGSIDPLEDIAHRARAGKAWLHVDAAYGGALLFSPRHGNKLDGLQRASSITLDFHKLCWQPISCGAFLVRDAAHFDCIKLHADYLNPESHEELGIPDLVARSVLTTRRFDALKVWFSFQVLGQRKLAALIDRTLDLATAAAEAIRRHPRLELLHEPALGCVVFRYRPAKAGMDPDTLNAALRRQLFDSGKAVIGHTRIRGQTYLKLTFLNPCLEPSHVADLLRLVVEQGRSLELDPRVIGPGSCSASVETMATPCS